VIWKVLTLLRKAYRPKSNTTWTGQNGVKTIKLLLIPSGDKTVNNSFYLVPVRTDHEHPWSSGWCRTAGAAWPWGRGRALSQRRSGPHGIAGSALDRSRLQSTPTATGQLEGACWPAEAACRTAVHSHVMAAVLTTRARRRGQAAGRRRTPKLRRRKRKTKGFSHMWWRIDRRVLRRREPWDEPGRVADFRRRRSRWPENLAEGDEDRKRENYLLYEGFPKLEAPYMVVLVCLGQGIGTYI